MVTLWAVSTVPPILYPLQPAHADSERQAYLQKALEFKAFLAELWPLAESQGISREVFDAAIAALTLDPSVKTSENQQPEFDRLTQDYVQDAVTPQRISRAQKEQETFTKELGEIEQRFGVPPEIILSLWALESDFGKLQGRKDVIRSLASLAFLRSDRELYKNELVSALTMLEKSGWPREKLQGSWAGAMGGPQFLPSAYLKYAVAFEGEAKPDIWAKPPDILASIAHFMKENGWVPGLRWGYEVTLPPAYGFENLHQDFASFARQGLTPADGSALPAQGQATLYLPAGAKGPAFLLSDNYWVFKAYNNSDAYALSAGLLTNRIASRPALHTPWPKQEPQQQLTRPEKIKVQQALSILGLYHGSIDGKFGQASRDAIHSFQIQSGHSPADGYATRETIEDLQKIPAQPAGK